jgi:threonine dehydratase
VEQQSLGYHRHGLSRYVRTSATDCCSRATLLIRQLVGLYTRLCRRSAAWNRPLCQAYTAAAMSAASDHVVCLADVQAAATRIAPLVHRTPVLTCAHLDKLASDGTTDGAPRHAFFKCELFQKSGSFKARGACNAVTRLSDEHAARGVCTHSSGNHAQALAVAAKLRGVPAYIVMPTNAPAVKRRAVEEYGGHVIECAPTQAAREAAAAKVVADTGAAFIHPSEHPDVIAGQGTIALELLPQAVEALAPAAPGAPALDAVIVPIGGGGMTSGVAAAVKVRCCAGHISGALTTGPVLCCGADTAASAGTA